MNVGDLDKPITLLQRTLSVDGDGIQRETFANPLQVFAEVVELTGTERFRSLGLQDLSARVARFTFWWSRAVSATDRVQYDGENWDILNFRNIGRNEMTEISAQVVK